MVRGVRVLVSRKRILRSNNFPQGLMDVIQILDFHHFKLGSFCHRVTK